MARLQRISALFEAARNTNSVSNSIDKCLASYEDITRFKACADLPRNNFSKFLSSILHDDSYLLNEEQEERIIQELGVHALHGEIDIYLWKKLFRYWLRKDTSPVSAFVAVDLQNDFIDGTLALKNCPAKHEGVHAVYVINQIKETYPFDYFIYTKDWHPMDHCSFVTNVHKYPLHETTPIPADKAKLFDKVVYGGKHAQEQILWPEHCIQGSNGAEFHPAVKTHDSDLVIYKGTNSIIDSYSAFWDNGRLSQTNLLGLLLDRNVTHVFVGGLAVDFCVSFTAIDAAEHGFETYYVADACRAIALERMKEMEDKMEKAGVKKIFSNQINDCLKKMNASE